MIVIFFFLSYLVVMFQIVGDLLRDSDLSGWIKALWILLLIALPVLTSLVYLVLRGSSMALRQQSRAEQAANSTTDYLRSVAGTSDPAKQILEAKSLLDSGTITEAEFGILKAKALA
ncbi:MAG: PLDc N-terminal domain-containing protein [Paeniglutamicibacter terrestris]|jgi:Na+-transporting methylmalonyl-CoA/oxaloacetate decarboxylase gamma subunit